MLGVVAELVAAGDPVAEARAHPAAALAWTVDEINERLERQILAAADAVWRRAAEDGIEPRLAAHSIAVERVAHATELRGLYP